MSRFRNLSQITLFALLVLGGVTLGLKLYGTQEVRAAHAVPVTVNAGHLTPDTLDTQATFTVTNADDGGADHGRGVRAAPAPARAAARLSGAGGWLVTASAQNLHHAAPWLQVLRSAQPPCLRRDPGARRQVEWSNRGKGG